MNEWIGLTLQLFTWYINGGIGDQPSAYPSSDFQWTTLPSNYRPPSSAGRAIPISSNIYNSDPSKPRYRNYFDESSSTGSYKQCTNRTNRYVALRLTLSIDLSMSDIP
jgi:hypothetical protein